MNVIHHLVNIDRLPSIIQPAISLLTKTAKATNTRYDNGLLGLPIGERCVKVHSFLKLHHFGLGLLLSHAVTGFAGDQCGSKEGYVNQLASRILIPDSFPPQNPALRSLVSDADLARCERLGSSDLGRSCQGHDECYDLRQPKDSCDRTLQDNWVKACKTTYFKLTFDHQICRLSCENFVKLMSEAQRYNSGDFCPSCDAYNTSISE